MFLPRLRQHDRIGPRSIFVDTSSFSGAWILVVEASLAFGVGAWVLTLAALRYDRGQSSHPDDLRPLSLFDPCLARRVPIFSFNRNSATVRIDRGQRGHGLSDQSFPSCFYRESLRTQSFSDYKKEKCGGDYGCRNDVAQRQTKKRIGLVKQHERAD